MDDNQQTTVRWSLVHTVCSRAQRDGESGLSSNKAGWDDAGDKKKQSYHILE